MGRFRKALPQLGGEFSLTDGGIETTLIFNEGLDLADFAAFDLLKRSNGEDALHKYFRTYAEMARRFSAGLILESATWRAMDHRHIEQIASACSPLFQKK